MNYTPRSAKEIAEMNLLPDGEYGFEVLNALDAVSKKGNGMIALELTVYTDAGARRTVKDWLVPGTNFGDRKIYEFTRATGLMNKYSTGSLSAEDCLGRTGFATIGREAGKEDGKGGFFADKNKIKFYLAEKSPAPAKPEPTEEQLANQTQDGGDSGLPF